MKAIDIKYTNLYECIDDLNALESLLQGNSHQRHFSEKLSNFSCGRSATALNHYYDELISLEEKLTELVGKTKIFATLIFDGWIDEENQVKVLLPGTGRNPSRRGSGSD